MRRLVCIPFAAFEGVALFHSRYHFRCVKKVRGGLFPKGRKSESHCIDTAVRSLTERPNSSRRSPRSKPMFSLPVPERIEGTGSVPRGVEFCVASFGKETPTDRLAVIASIRRLNSYHSSVTFSRWTVRLNPHLPLCPYMVVAGPD